MVDLANDSPIFSRWSSRFIGIICVWNSDSQSENKKKKTNKLFCFSNLRFSLKSFFFFAALDSFQCDDQYVSFVGHSFNVSSLKRCVYFAIEIFFAVNFVEIQRLNTKTENNFFQLAHKLVQHHHFGVSAVNKSSHELFLSFEWEFSVIRQLRALF